MNLENTLNDYCTFDQTMDIIDNNLTSMRSDMSGIGSAVSGVDGRVSVVNTKVDIRNAQALNFRLAVEQERSGHDCQVPRHPPKESAGPRSAATATPTCWP
jgi:hypothetical protein